jgi:hypothetical protein
MQAQLPDQGRQHSCVQLSIIARVAALVFALGAVGSVSHAKAMSLYGGALGGYGFATQNVGGIDPFGLALGANAGVSLPIIPIYVGARVLWYDGSTGSSVAGLGKLSRNYLTYGVDLGYDAELGPIVLRPSLGIGTASQTLSGPVGIRSLPKDSTLYLSPGVALLVKVGLFYVGGEARYNVLTRHNRPDGGAILANVGLTL